jgi:NADH-quinone oxidoreductase subunit M
MLRTIALLALGTAVYGAALALVQTSARRACGYLFMSQSALVMTGLDCTSVTALAGGLLVWLSAGLAFAGLARCVLVLEARRGRLDLTTYHGGYERMPVLAISFLAMGSHAPGFQERSASSARNSSSTAPWMCSRSWDSLSSLRQL